MNEELEDLIPNLYKNFTMDGILELKEICEDTKISKSKKDMVIKFYRNTSIKIEETYRKIKQEHKEIMESLKEECYNDSNN